MELDLKPIELPGIEKKRPMIIAPAHVVPKPKNK